MVLCRCRRILIV